METFYEWCGRIKSHNIICIMILFIVADIVFGTLRAIRQRCFNSSVGIDGVIRKIGMLFSMAFLPLIDSIFSIDAAKLIPQEINEIIHLNTTGLTEFFGLLFIAYESVSVLKNMTLSGMPTKAIWQKTFAFLSKWTKELPETPIENKDNAE